MTACCATPAAISTIHMSRPLHTPCGAPRTADGRLLGSSWAVWMATARSGRRSGSRRHRTHAQPPDRRTGGRSSSRSGSPQNGFISALRLPGGVLAWPGCRAVLRFRSGPSGSPGDWMRVEHGRDVARPERIAISVANPTRPSRRGSVRDQPADKANSSMKRTIVRTAFSA